MTRKPLFRRAPLQHISSFQAFQRVRAHRTHAWERRWGQKRREQDGRDRLERGEERIFCCDSPLCFVVAISVASRPTWDGARAGSSLSLSSLSIQTRQVLSRISIDIKSEARKGGKASRRTLTRACSFFSLSALVGRDEARGTKNESTKNLSLLIRHSPARKGGDFSARHVGRKTSEGGKKSGRERLRAKKTHERKKNKDSEGEQSQGRRRKKQSGIVVKGNRGQSFTLFPRFTLSIQPASHERAPHAGLHRGRLRHAGRIALHARALRARQQHRRRRRTRRRGGKQAIDVHRSGPRPGRGRATDRLGRLPRRSRGGAPKASGAGRRLTEGRSRERLAQEAELGRGERAARARCNRRRDCRSGHGEFFSFFFFHDPDLDLDTRPLLLTPFSFPLTPKTGPRPPPGLLGAPPCPSRFAAGLQSRRRRGTRREPE